MKYGGIIMYIFGTIGNLLNICVFTIWCRRKKPSNRHHTSNSSLYLLVSSISNLLVILYPLLTRILLDGYKYQITNRNVFFVCNLRYYILHTFDLLSLSCICLATFDRYLITSREARLRKLNPTKKRTKLILFFLLCLFVFHSIPILIYYDVSITGHCTIVSSIYLYYYLYTFQIFLHGIIPIIFLSIFGILTLKQLQIISKRKNHHLERFQSDKQLSRMLLMISLAIILSSIPYCIEQSYYVLFNGNNRSQTSFFFLFHVTCSILFYTNPVSNFYIYYISTRNFRMQVHRIVLCRRTIHYTVFYQIKPMTIIPKKECE
jgi:hypothetical protein